mgnify:FL=1
MSLGPFAGITGSLKALRDIFPASTDTKINRLDATISSRLSTDLGARQIELNAVKTKVDLNLDGKISDVQTKVNFIPSALTAGTLDTSRNTAIQNKVNFIPSALTAGTTDTTRHADIITDIAGVLYGVSTRQTESDALVRYNAIIARTGIKNIFYKSVDGYGPGVKTSTFFNGNYTVDRDHTFIIPLCFGGFWQFNWALSASNKQVQFYPTGSPAADQNYHAGNCIVIEFNG